MSGKIYFNHHEFWKRVDPVDDLEILPPAPFAPNYWTEDLPVVFEFLRQHPHMHLVSYVKGGVLNRYVPNASFYSLAEGDPDPEITYVRPPLPSRPGAKAR